MTTNIISSTPLSERNEWRTPPEVFAWARALLGGIEYDTACTAPNSLAYPIAQSRGIGHDALAVDWRGTCWCNPPYNDIAPWVDKAIASNAITAMLIPTPNGEDRNGRLIQNAHEITIIGRLAFLKPDGTPVSGNTRGSSLFIINGYGQGSRSVITRDEIWAMYGGGT